MGDPAPAVLDVQIRAGLQPQTRALGTCVLKMIRAAAEVDPSRPIDRPTNNNTSPVSSRSTKPRSRQFANLSPHAAYLVRSLSSVSSTEAMTACD